MANKAQQSQKPAVKPKAFNVPSILKIQDISKKKTGKRLTVKQAGFVAGILEGKEPQKVVMEVYDSGKKHGISGDKTKSQTASVMANENLRNPNIVATTNAIAESVGLTPFFVIEALKSDIEEKPKMRARELELAGKWLGLEKPAQNNTINVLQSITEEQANRLLSL